MISFDEAIARIGSATRRVPTEPVPLDRAHGRVLAAPVVAQVDSPRCDVSAMDGYAVRSTDLESFPLRLSIVGQSLPGMPWTQPILPGTCTRIFTGAPVPQGADLIVIQEQVRREGDEAILVDSPGNGSWLRRRGGDFREGHELVGGGRLIDSKVLVAIAGGDVGEVVVSARPRVALLATGDELAEAGTARSSALAVPDSVSVGIAALAREWGGAVVQLVRLVDDLGLMESAAREAVSLADVIIVTGGASVGERDFAKTMFLPLGLDLIFSKVAIRPGMPAWFGCVSDKLILGLPGNPTSALVTARLLLAPLLANLQGRSPAEALAFDSISLAAPLPACDARETFHRARLIEGRASPLAFQESHGQKSLAEASALIRQPANSSELRVGDPVEVLRL